MRGEGRAVGVGEAARPHILARPVAYVQENQPEGVPPLALTGERTLPDVPEENYWYRRHLAVYEWIAARTRGLRVVDLACGEGYGSACLARTAAAVVGVDANPEAHEHARLRYVAENLRFERGLVEDYSDPCDAVVFLQTIEHIHDPGALLAADRQGRAPRFRLDSQPADAGTRGRREVGESVAPSRIHGRRVPRAPRASLLGGAPARRSSTRASCVLHEVALGLGWDRVHKATRITKPFYDRFTPAISASDFTLRDEKDCDLDGALDFLAVLRT